MTGISLKVMQDRRRRVRQALDSAGIDALLVSDRLNFAYLTGHLSREFERRYRQLLVVLDRDGRAHVLAPPSDATALAETAPDLKVQRFQFGPLDPGSAADFIRGALGPGRQRLGIEQSGADRPCLTGTLMSAVADLLPTLTPIDASPILARVRLVKSSEEIATLRTAGAIAGNAWEATLPRLRVGMEVGRVAGLLAAAFADQGADYNFPGHIEVRNASDPRSATLLEGQVVWCDFGVTVAGYHSDISRRAVLGSATASQRESHGKGWRLLETLIQDLKPGRTIAEAMHAMLALRTSFHAGTDEHQRFGHGIGLSGAEPPSLAAHELELVEEGMVLTPEPSFTTVSGEFVHLEEMIAIGAKDALLLTGGAATLYEIG
jgi:Xaa-Pro aminopeptidase